MAVDSTGAPSEVLDIVALRTFTVIADAGGFRRASELLHISQSAVSQQVKRLEQAAGCSLFERDGRGVRFTADGEILLSEARKVLAAHDDALAAMRVGRPGQAVVIGAVEHGADHLLPAITSAVLAVYPQASLRYRIDGGAVLSERLAGGDVDAAVLIGDAREGNRRGVGALPLAWYSAPGWVTPPGPVPLVAISGTCTIRRRAVQALGDNDIDSTVVCETGHLAGVLSAVRAGVGVALLVVPGGSVDGLERRDEFPAVEAEPLFVSARVGAPAPLVAAVSRAVADSCVQRGR